MFTYTPKSGYGNFMPANGWERVVCESMKANGGNSDEFAIDMRPNRAATGSFKHSCDYRLTASFSPKDLSEHGRTTMWMHGPSGDEVAGTIFFDDHTNTQNLRMHGEQIEACKEIVDALAKLAIK